MLMPFHFSQSVQKHHARRSMAVRYMIKSHELANELATWKSQHQRDYTERYREALQVCSGLARYLERPN